MSNLKELKKEHIKKKRNTKQIFLIFSKKQNLHLKNKYENKVVIS